MATTLHHPAATCRSREWRRSGADARATARADRSARQQLAHLDALLGKNVGARKERARLARTTPAAARLDTPCKAGGLNPNHQEA